MSEEDKTGWSQWSQYILKELVRLNKHLQVIEERTRNIETELAVLKTKLLFLGTGAGVLTSACVSLIVNYFRT